MSVNNNIISAAISGHNFFILGQAGTGKSTVVKELYEILTSLGKKVKTAASTGLAATRLPNGTTVHHLFGLLDGRYPLEQLKKKISQDDSYRSVKNMILSTDSIIIDEVSMLSRKIFETVEGLCRFIRNNDSPFGGIQFILVGDFYQLRPVPNMISGDSGEVLLETPNIRNLVPHKFILTEVHRQEEADLVHAVNELSHGYASPETKKLLESLTRPLAPGEPTARLFAQNYDVDKCNSDYLLDMEDVLEIHGRLFDHRPVLQGHISNFVKEFEEKRGNREIDRLDSLHQNVSDMKKHMTESTTSLDTFLANIQAKLQVAVEVCKRIQEKENNVEINFLDEERAKRRAEWDQFMQHQFEKSAQVDEDVDSEVQKIVIEYEELESKLDHISTQSP